MPASPASRTKARDDFAAWGRNHQKRSTKAKRIHSASRTEVRDDFAAWGRNHQKRSTTRDDFAAWGRNHQKRSTKPPQQRLAKVLDALDDTLTSLES